MPREAGGNPLDEIGSTGYFTISDKAEVSVDFPDKAYSFSAALHAIMTIIKFLFDVA